MLLFSCQKEETPIPVPTDPVQQARQLVDSLRRYATADRDPLNHRLKYESKIMWSEASVLQNASGDSLTVFVELKADETLYTYTGDQEKVKLSNLLGYRRRKERNGKSIW